MFIKTHLVALSANPRTLQSKQGDQIRRSFAYWVTLGSFCKKTEITQIIVLFISALKVTFLFRQKTAWPTFWLFYTDASGHPEILYGFLGLDAPESGEPSFSLVVK
jgi:hypothetical protein